MLTVRAQVRAEIERCILVDEAFPGVAAGFDNGVAVFEHAIGGLVLSQILPEAHAYGVGKGLHQFPMLGRRH
jgi:hypothetical protein